MVLFGHSTVSSLDGELVCISRNIEDFVIVLRLGAFQQRVSLLQQGLKSLRGSGMMFFGRIQA